MVVLYKSIDPHWIEKAQKLDFPFDCVVLDSALASTFVTNWFNPVLKPKNAMELVVEAASCIGADLLRLAPVACARIFHLVGGKPGSWLSQDIWNKYFSVFLLELQK